MADLNDVAGFAQGVIGELQLDFFGSGELDGGEIGGCVKAIGLGDARRIEGNGTAADRDRHQSVGKHDDPIGCVVTGQLCGAAGAEGFIEREISVVAGYEKIGVGGAGQTGDEELTVRAHRVDGAGDGQEGSAFDAGFIEVGEAAIAERHDGRAVGSGKQAWRGEWSGV